MKNFEKIFFGLILGGVFPLLFALLSMVLWFYLDRNEDHTCYYLTTSLTLGLIVDLKYLKIWIDERYELPLWFLSCIYIFYNICIYGFFMGFPVFNLIMGFVAGYYLGKRICSNNIPAVKSLRVKNQVVRFTGLIMIILCIFSGFLALAGKGAGKDIQGMLGLNFEVTKLMIWGTIFPGGILLFIIQMLITKWTINRTINSR